MYEFRDKCKGLNWTWLKYKLYRSLSIRNILIIYVVTVSRISYSDFVKTFTHLEVVHLDAETSRDEPSLHSKHTWQMKLYQGSWRRGVTAGGCRNNQGSFKYFTYSLCVYLTKLATRIVTNIHIAVCQISNINLSNINLFSSSFTYKYYNIRKFYNFSL